MRQVCVECALVCTNFIEYEAYDLPTSVPTCHRLQKGIEVSGCRTTLKASAQSAVTPLCDISAVYGDCDCQARSTSASVDPSNLLTSTFFCSLTRTSVNKDKLKLPQFPPAVHHARDAKPLFSSSYALQVYLKVVSWLYADHEGHCLL